MEYRVILHRVILRVSTRNDRHIDRHPFYMNSITIQCFHLFEEWTLLCSTLCYESIPPKRYSNIAASNIDSLTTASIFSRHSCVHTQELSDFISIAGLLPDITTNTSWCNWIHSTRKGALGRAHSMNDFSMIGGNSTFGLVFISPQMIAATALPSGDVPNW